MKVQFLGGRALADTLAHAAQRRGFEIGDDDPALVFVALEVEDHDNLFPLLRLMTRTFAATKAPVVVTSQVPPGWTRQWTYRPHVFYQPHTLIKGREAEMAYAPEVLVVGMADPHAPLPGAYAKYLSVFECPVHRMSYESAELSKLALNYLLARSIKTANDLKRVAETVGADWKAVEPVIRADRRIGKHAYIHPGEAGGHLPRDVKTIERLLS